jgi:predicted nucleic acid-binding protein
MAGSVVVDAGFLVALLDRRDGHHGWAIDEAARYARPWQTCESVLSEAFFLLGPDGRPGLVALLGRGFVLSPFRLNQELQPVLALMRKYANVPMSLADACLVRMAELLPEPVVLTTDTDFRIYRRNGRRVVPCVLPS